MDLDLEYKSTAPRTRENSAIERVRVVCDLFNLAFEIKSLELERRNPTASKEWIKAEMLRLIELGTR